MNALSQTFLRWSIRLNAALPKDGTEALTGPLTLGTYTVATLPAAASHPGAILYVSDGSAGQKFRGSDGSSWLNIA